MRRLPATVSAVLVLAACTGTGVSASTASDTTSISMETASAMSFLTTTSAPTTTLSQAEVFADRVATIEAMVADFNSGDFDAWRAHFIAERPNIFASIVKNDMEDLEWQRSFMAANEVWTITGECTNVGTVRVSCPFSKENEFHGPAGIAITVPRLTFSFDEDLQISEMSTEYWEVAQDPAVFNAAFDAWLAETHPEVYESFGPRVEGEEGLPNPDDMPTALEYIAEFIEQSDEYPVG